MKTAEDFKRAAEQMSRAADRMTPPEGDRHFEIRSLIVYHLRSAASKARAVAEDLSKASV